MTPTLSAVVLLSYALPWDHLANLQCGQPRDAVCLRSSADDLWSFRVFGTAAFKTTLLYILDTSTAPTNINYTSSYMPWCFFFSGKLYDTKTTAISFLHLHLFVNLVFVSTPAWSKIHWVAHLCLYLCKIFELVLRNWTPLSKIQGQRACLFGFSWLKHSNRYLTDICHCWILQPVCNSCSSINAALPQAK